MSKENKLNVEVGDSVILKDIIFNNKGVLVSKDFQNKIGSPMDVKSTENGMITVEGFDEQFPVDWVKKINWKHYSEEELSRKELLENKINSFHSISGKIACFIDRHFGWFLVIGIIGMILFDILFLYNYDTISLIDTLIRTALSVLIFFLPAILWVLCFGIYRKQKKHFDTLLKNKFSITIAEYYRFHLQMSTSAFTKKEWDEYSQQKLTN